VNPCVAGFSINPMNLMDFQGVEMLEGQNCHKP